MSIDKWLFKKDFKEENNRKNDLFKNLPKEKAQELKMRSVRKISRRDSEPAPENALKTDDFLDEIIKFKNWLDKRTYLKGDRDKVETWIANLFNKIQFDAAIKSTLDSKSDKNELLAQYKKIPPKFLDEKTRIAVNKKIEGSKRSSMDNYYLTKLKAKVQEKSKEAEYYEILKKILDF
jgi:hypothetical protein